MRKIFSTVLVATALLFSMQAKAAFQNVTDEADLKSKINKGNGATIELKLTQDIILTSGPINVYAGKSQTGENITIDLNGYQISSSTWTCFNLFKGQLTIMTSNKDGKNKIINTCEADNTWKSVCFNVFGTDRHAESNWSILNIADGVTVSSTRATPSATGDRGGSKGIQVYQSQTGYFTEANGLKEVNDNLGEGFYVSYNNDVNDPDGVEYDMYGEEGKKSRAALHAFGVVVNVKSGASVHGDEYGVQVTGNVRDKSGNLPKVTIESGATITCHPTTKQSTAVYACTGDWTIQGNVSGSTGIYIKGGTVVVDGATVTSTNTEYSQVTALGSGVNTGGSAIVCEVNPVYTSDAINLTVKGTTEISSGSGYAVEGVVSQGATWDESSIEIQGGTVSGGTEGCVGLDATIAKDVKEEGTIKGGTYNGDITSYLNTNTGIIVPVEDENGNTTYTVSEKDPSDTWIYDLNAADADKLVEVKADVTVSGAVEAKYIAVKAGYTITIPNGATLTAGEIVMGDGTAVINVAPQGKLIITGKQGLVSNYASSLILNADDQYMAKFLLAPDVESNLQPYATVYYYAKYARQTGESRYKFDRMASITVGTPDYRTSVKPTTYGGKAWGTGWDKWNASTGAWEGVTFDADQNPKLVPFVGYRMANTSLNGGAQYEFKGRLQGTKPYNMAVVKGWNYVGNSYTAPMNASKLAVALYAQGITNINLWDAENQRYIDVNATDIIEGIGGDYNIQSMQTFIFKSNKEFNLDLDYEETVWEYNVQ